MTRKYSIAIAAVILSGILIFVFRSNKAASLLGKDYVSDENKVRYDTMRGTTSRKGIIWPQPQFSKISLNKSYVISPKHFTFEYTSNSVRCNEIDEAIGRYTQIIFGNARVKDVSPESERLERFYVHIATPCEQYPSIKSSENYVLSVAEVAMVTADTQWGILRGLETFSQLVHRNEWKEFVVFQSTIEDFPRFPHRGLMLDTARHFLPVDTILKNLEIMSYNKLNVLHWHISDDQSFPLRLDSMPELSQKGSYSYERATYSTDDVKRIVQFARKRGIRVIPEIDFPGHIVALTKSHPDIFILCHDGSLSLYSDVGSLNPLHTDIYTFVSKVYKELSELFPDEYIHIGGDEVSIQCWTSNSDFQKFIYDTRISEFDVHKLLVEGLLQEARKLNLKPILWNDAYNHGYTMTPAVVEVWSWNPPPDFEVSKYTQASVDVIVSFPWYLDNTLKKDWGKLYSASPTKFVSEEAKKHVLGGESCMWGEHVDENNIFTETWPLASATAERLWSDEFVLDLESATTRLMHFRCVMNDRNVKSTPIAPGYCLALED